MALLIGTDEAGYGPSLGPLVITATGWQCQQRSSNLYHLLQDVVTDSPKLANKNNADRRILIADSKIACRSGAIGSLELSVLVLLKAVCGKVPATLRELVALVTPDAEGDFFQNHFWLKRSTTKLPLVASDDRLALIFALADRFQEACQQNHVRLSKIRSTILLPPEFNAAVASLGNKANLLSDRTLRLVAELTRNSSAATLIECDKHGGRNYYHPMVAGKLTNQPVTTVIESPSTSIYQWNEAGHEMEIRFTAKGEDQLPVALASMVSKYLREAFMEAWNQFWKGHIPDIKPTKGYPQDAKRFLAEIKQVAAAKRYFRHEFWRNC